MRAVVVSVLQAPIVADDNAVVWAGSGIILLVGLVAFFLGYKSDDSYPGYGAVQRDFYRARDEFHFQEKRMRKRINGIVDQADADVTKLRGRFRTQVRQFSKLVEESKRVPARLSEYDDVLEDACNILLDRYRTANIAARQTDSPASFTSHVKLRPAQENCHSAADYGEPRQKSLEDSIAELDREIVLVRERLRDLNWHAIKTLEGVPWQGDVGSMLESDVATP